MTDRYLLPVAIGGHRYLADLRGYSRETLPWQRQSYDGSDEPGEGTLNTYGAWTRFQDDWSLGSGQRWFDRPIDSRRRTWESFGLDPWEAGEVRLVQDYRTAYTISGGGATGYIAAGGNWLFAASGTVVVKSNNSGDATPSFTTMTYAGTAIAALAAGSGYVYASDGNNVYRCPVGETDFGSIWSAGVGHGAKMWYVNGRLLIAGPGGNQVREIDATGTRGTVITMGMDTQDMIGTHQGIFAIGYETDGVSTGYVKRIPIAQDGSLGEPEIAAVLPEGERGFALAASSSFALLGTDFGLRMAEIGGDGTMVYGPLREIVTGLGYTPMSIVAVGADFWVHYNEAGLDAVARVRLDELLGPLAPPLVPERALAAGEPVAFGAVAGARWPAILSRSDILTVYETDVPTNETWGYFTTGWITYGVSEGKLPTAINIELEPLPANCSVMAELIEADGTTTSPGTLSLTGATSHTWPITDFDHGQRFRIRFQLFSDGSDTPVLTRWTMRALPVPERTEAFVVPIVLRETVQGASAGIDVPFDPRAEYDHLKALELAHTPVDYEEGDTTFQVVVDSVSLPADDERVWTSGREFPQGLAVVTMLTV